ncbi:MAG: hypothetical protein ACKVH0_06585 [Alphaproteobacteria bacterium]
MNKVHQTKEIVGETKATQTSRQKGPVTVIDTEELNALRKELAAAKAALAFIGESGDILSPEGTEQKD